MEFLIGVDNVQVGLSVMPPALVKDSYAISVVTLQVEDLYDAQL
jgi:hypothetical protein